MGTGAGMVLPLLNITLDADNRLRVSSTFGNVKCSAIKDILADAAEDFVNECHSKGDDEAVTIRKFIALREAAMISVSGPQVRKELLQNLATNVGYFEKNTSQVTQICNSYNFIIIFAKKRIMSTDQTSRRLQFFWDMIQMRGHNRNTIAKVLEYTQPGIQRWWTTDDIRYSLILETAAKIGVKLDIALVNEDGDDNKEQTPVHIKDILKNVTGKGYTVRRLAFIEIALLRYNISKTDWADAVGCGQVAIYQWLKKDDLMWSRVCQFAQAFNLNIIIKVTAPSTTRIDNKKSRIIVNLTQDYECENTGLDAPMPIE